MLGFIKEINVNIKWNPIFQLLYFAISEEPGDAHKKSGRSLSLGIAVQCNTCNVAHQSNHRTFPLPIL